MVRSTPSPLALARAIARALRKARREGQTPEAIVMGPQLLHQLQDRALNYVWTGPSRTALFHVPVEIHAEAQGWTIRTKPDASLSLHPYNQQHGG